MKRFRGSIYVDIFVPCGDDTDVEEAGKVASQKMSEYARRIPNAYVGGAVMLYDDDLLGNEKRLGER